MKRAFFSILDGRPMTLTRKIVVVVSSVMLLGVIGWADYATGPTISCGIFYFLPIWLITWNFKRSVGILFCLICAIAWFVIDKASGADYPNPLIHYWNAVVRLGYFLTFSILLSKVREQLEESRAEVKRLSGLLPICASGKKIRNDKGYWEQLEEYIGDRSEAEFSHGICPECARKLYPEFADQLLKNETAAEN